MIDLPDETRIRISRGLVRSPRLVAQAKVTAALALLWPDRRHRLADLADLARVSVRTIYRDRRSLRALGLATLDRGDRLQLTEQASAAPWSAVDLAPILDRRAAGPAAVAYLVLASYTDAAGRLSPSLVTIGRALGATSDPAALTAGNRACRLLTAAGLLTSRQRDGVSAIRKIRT